MAAMARSMSRNARAGAAGEEKAGGKRKSRQRQDGERQGLGKDAPQRDNLVEASPKHDDAAIWPLACDEQGRLGVGARRGLEILDQMRLAVDGDVRAAVEIAENQRAAGVVKRDIIQLPEIAREPQRQAAPEPVLVGGGGLFGLVGKNSPQFRDPSARRRDVNEAENAAAQQHMARAKTPARRRGVERNRSRLGIEHEPFATQVDEELFLARSVEFMRKLRIWTSTTLLCA